MERLTWHRETPLVMSVWAGDSKSLQIYNRLAAYEDTGLTPEDIKVVMGREETLAKTICYLTHNHAVTYDRVRELVQAEQEGRLLISPCKDFLNVMFEVDTFFILDDGDVIEATNSDEKWFNYDKHTGDITISFIDGDNEIFYIKMSEIGKTVFLTRAEAEAALAKEGEK